MLPLDAAEFAKHARMYGVDPNQPWEALRRLGLLTQRDEERMRLLMRRRDMMPSLMKQAAGQLREVGLSDKERRQALCAVAQTQAAALNEFAAMPSDQQQAMLDRMEQEQARQQQAEQQKAVDSQQQGMPAALPLRPQPTAQRHVAQDGQKPGAAQVRSARAISTWQCAQNSMCI